MLLTTILSGELYQFEVVLLRDEKAEKIYFYIETLDGNYNILEKLTKGGKWVKCSGGVISADLLAAILEEIDNTSAVRLIEEAVDISQIDGFELN